MNRIFLSAAAVSLLALGACGTITDERLSSIIVDGQEHTLRTRTIERGGTSFVTTAAEVRGHHFICKIDSPGSCEAAVRLGRSELTSRSSN